MFYCSSKVTALLEYLDLVHLQYRSGFFLHNLQHKSSDNVLESWLIRSIYYCYYYYQALNICIISDHINYAKTNVHYSLQHIAK